MNLILPKSKVLASFLFFVLAQTIGFSATITSTVAGGNWNSTSSWIGGVIPTVTDDVVIASGSTVMVTADAFAKSINVSGGVLTINNAKKLTVFSNIDINSTGQFNGGTVDSDSATIKVFGNFTSFGTANFWKSTVVIKGNLSTTSTILQNNGNILVGGNISGVIGGSGSGNIYPVNPNAIVNLSGNATKLPAGTQPTDSTLATLMNEVIYGGVCSPSIALSSINASSACKSTNQSTVTIISTSPSMLPVGTYTVIYDLYNNGNNLTASMSVGSAGTGVFVANVSVVSATSSANIRIKKIASSSCYSDISLNNYSNNFYMFPVLTAPTVSNGFYQCDKKWVAQWTPDSTLDGYYLDVASDVSFMNYFTGYQNKYIAGGSTQSEVIANLAYGGIYYYRLRGKSYCGTSANSNTITISITGNGSSTPGTIGGGASSICVGTTTTFTITGSNPSTGQWSIFNQTGSASITAGGVVTGVSPGEVLVVFTTQNGGCGTSTTKALTISGGTVSTASSAPTVCVNTVMTNITHSATGFTGISNSGVSGSNGLPAGLSASYVSNVVTISGTPTVSGTFNYSIPLTGGICGVANATGTITVNAGLSAAPVTPNVDQNFCFSASGTALTVAPIGGGTVTYQWGKCSVSGGAITAISGQIASSYIPSAAVLTAGTWFIVCTSTPTCGSQIVSNQVAVTVNPTPTLSGASQPVSACDGFGATISLAGLLANSTSTINYSINGTAQTAVTGVVANGSGVASFTTGVLSIANDGQTLQITGVTTTSAVPNCTAGFTQNVTLSVKSDIGGISLNGVAYASNGSALYCSFTAATFSIAPVTGATTYTWFVPSGWKTEGGVAITGPIITAISELKVITGSSTDNGNVAVTASTVFCPSYLGVTLSNTAPSKLTISKTDPICAVPTGTVKAAPLSPPVIGTLTYTLIKTNVIPEVVIGTNGIGEFTGLAGGDYVMTYQINSGCHSFRSDPVTIVPLVTKTWNGSWSPAGAPSFNDYVVFDADYSEPVSVNSCSCQINLGKKVTITSGLVLNIVNGLDVKGTLIFENNASLVQLKDDAINQGVITYKRITPLLRDLDYEYWSSPVAGQTLGDLWTSDRYFKYTNGAWEGQASGTTMEIGRGYIIRVRTATPFNQGVAFKGSPNNGVKKIATQGVNKSNLIGNPYPSALDGETFMINNPVTGALYFWTHFTARKVDNTGTKLIYNADDYAVFNLLGGTSTVAKSIKDAGAIGVTPNGKIAAGQSFFVVSDKVGDFTFNNSMRFDSHTGSIMDNSQFFRPSGTKKEAKIEKDRVWLNLTNEGGAFKQLLVGYVTGASNDFDKLYDGITRNGNAFVDFYSVNNSNNYTIQGRALPFDKADEVPLGYKTTIAGTFKIEIDKVDGGMVSQPIYLEDKQTNTIHDLKAGSYSFATEIGGFNDRFVLRYTNTPKLDTGDAQFKGKGVFVSVRNRVIKINSFDQTINSVKVYDLKGSLLYDKEKVGANEFVIDTLNSGDQFMIVMVQLEDGKWISEEIIFHD